MLIRIAGVCTSILFSYACYWAIRWTAADCIAQDFSREGIQSALRLASGNPEYYVRLAEADPPSALSAMQRAVILNPLNSPVWIGLARADEERGDLRGAERSLVRAVHVDQTFGPRWLLAEYYSRQHDEEHFWPAIHAALAASYDDVRPLFESCWNFAPDPKIIRERAVPDRADVLQQYFDFLIAKNRLDAADDVARQLVRHADPDSVPSLLNYCNRLLENNDSARAVEIWNALTARRLLPYAELVVPEGISLTNGTFKQPFLAKGFDWHMPAVEGIFTQTENASSGLRFDFSGNQPESCELLSQFVPIEAARSYGLSVRYASPGLQRDTGLKWRVLDGVTGADLLAADGKLTGEGSREKQEQYEFRTPAGARLVKVVLGYQRLPGTVRIEGSLVLRDVALGLTS